MKFVNGLPFVYLSIGRLKVTDEFACGRLCLHRNGCVSYNYQFENGNGTFHKCELNSQTKEAKPETFQEVRGFLYFGSLYEREVGILSDLIERQGG